MFPLMNGAYSSSHSSPTGVKDTKEPSELCANKYWTSLYQDQEIRHIRIKVSIPSEVVIVGAMEERVRFGRVDQGREKMESSPRLGLGTINIAPFVEGLIFY